MLQLEIFGHHFVIYFYNYLFFFFPKKFSILVYQGYFNVLDDQYNRWITGQISQRYYSQGFRFIIKYGRKYYLMENKIGSLITEIRDQKRKNYVLTRFYKIYENPFFGSSKYNIQVYTDDLPDPIYVLALYALDSIAITKRKNKFISQQNFLNNY